MTVEEAKASILRHVEHGIEPGGFIEAVLENDLKEALGRGDLESLANLFAIVSFCYNDIPAGAWGSPKKVQAWRRQVIQDREADHG